MIVRFVVLPHSHCPKDRSFFVHCLAECWHSAGFDVLFFVCSLNANGLVHFRHCFVDAVVVVAAKLKKKKQKLKK